MAARSKDNLRSPICCILGHVDTGKTKLLDKIRQTNVQEGEAGGITQQIGATYFPVDAIKTKTQVVNKDNTFEFKVPGLLVIDTPGHESFSNLRSRGSSLCNIAILVVDIMHGLEPQTLESMKLLRDRKTPFIVALNKIDRLYGWKKVDNNGFQESLALQNKGVQNEFAKRLADTKVAFTEQGFNSELYYENKSMAKFVSLVPTSAHTGEGIPDMLKLIIQLTQERMVGSLMYLSEVQCTVLEVKAIEGFGMTIDVILSNGILREGDRIVLCGVDGAITTNIRALLTPAPLKELRLKSQYVHNKEVKAALGVKISAPNLEGAIAGSRLMVVGPDDDESDIEAEVESDLGALFSRVEKSGRGVTVQASTLGSLEALLDFLKVSKIPVANVGIGPVYKRDVMNCGTMLEKNKEYAVMLCFDVKIDKEAQQYADEQGIKIFTAAGTNNWWGYNSNYLGYGLIGYGYGAYTNPLNNVYGYGWNTFPYNSYFPTYTPGVVYASPSIAVSYQPGATSYSTDIYQPTASVTTPISYRRFRRRCRRSATRSPTRTRLPGNIAGTIRVDSSGDCRSTYRRVELLAARNKINSK